MQSIQTLKSIINSKHFQDYLIHQVISGESPNRTFGMVNIEYSSSIGKLVMRAADAVLQDSKVTLTISGYVTKEGKVVMFDTNKFMYPEGSEWVSVKLTLNKQQSNCIREYSPIYMKLLYK